MTETKDMDARIAKGFRLMTTGEASSSEWNDTIRNLLDGASGGHWCIALLHDGRIGGRGYNYKVEDNDSENLGHAIMITTGI